VKRNHRSSRASWAIISSLIGAIFLGSIALVSYFRSRTTKPVARSLLPEMAIKPQPLVRTFNGCPPQGDGGDRDLNRLKIALTTDNLFPCHSTQLSNSNGPGPLSGDIASSGRQVIW